MSVWLALTPLLVAVARAGPPPRPGPPRPPITALAISPDGKSAVVGSQAGLKVLPWPGLDEGKASALPTRLAHVHDMAFSPDGKALAAVGGRPARRGTIELYRWPGGKLLRRADVSKDLLYGVSWRSDSKALATAGADQVVRLHEAATLKTVRSLEGHSRGALAAVFLPTGGVVSAGLDESLRMWSADKGALLRTLSNHTRPVLGLAVRPGTGKALPMVASVSEDGTLRLWQPTIGRLVRFVRLKSVPLAVAWSADGEKVLASCKDGRVRVIDPDTVEVLLECRGIDGVAHSLAVAADGSVLVGGQGGQLRRVPPGGGR
jgi:WD40 repeat protein